MGLDFMLKDKEDNEVFCSNITHNLTAMAKVAGLYKVLWRPDENNYTKAYQCIEPLSIGLLELVRNKAMYESYNSPNGWGMYEHFVPFVTSILSACCENTEANVVVSR